MTNDKEKKFAEQVDAHLAGTTQAGDDEVWETIYALRPDLAPAPNVRHEELVDALNVTVPAPVNRSMRWRVVALTLSAAAAVLIFIPSGQQDREVIVYDASEGRSSNTADVVLEANVTEATLIGGAAGLESEGRAKSRRFETTAVAPVRPARKRAPAQADMAVQLEFSPRAQLIAEASEGAPNMPQTRDELLAKIQPPEALGAATALQVAKEFIKRKDLLSAEVAVKMGIEFGETPSKLALKELETWLQEHIPPTP